MTNGVTNGDGRGVRVCVLGERLRGAPDEGVRKSTLALAGALSRRHDVSILAAEPAPGTGTGTEIPVRPATGPAAGRAAGDMHVVATDRTFLGGGLRRELERLDPEVLVYAARSSTTFMSFLRCMVLRVFRPRTTQVLVGMQRRVHARWQRPFLRYLAPHLICVQSEESRRYLSSQGCRVIRLPSGIDLESFRPVPPETRAHLRHKYGLPAEMPVVLHVGHLKESRGVHVLASLASSGACTPVLVASSSTAQEQRVATALRAAGVHLFTEYLPAIHELYQLADCYVFPVQSADDAIEVPLSVLEAFACDLPVVTTRFGDLPALFDHPDMRSGVVFVETLVELCAEAARMSRAFSGGAGTRPLALQYSWDSVAERLLAGVGLGSGEIVDEVSTCR